MTSARAMTILREAGVSSGIFQRVLACYNPRFWNTVQ